MKVSGNARFTSGGPGWYDVKLYMIDVAAAHNGSVWVIAGLGARAEKKEQLYWRVCFARGPAKSDFHAQYEERSWWPNADYETVPALLMYLIYLLDAKLTDYERLKAEQAHF